MLVLCDFGKNFFDRPLMKGGRRVTLRDLYKLPEYMIGELRRI